MEYTSQTVPTYQDDGSDFIKSIIYGNQVKNSYGNFRAFCSAISLAKWEFSTQPV